MSGVSNPPSWTTGWLGAAEGETDSEGTVVDEPGGAVISGANVPAWAVRSGAVTCVVVASVEGTVVAAVVVATVDGGVVTAEGVGGATLVATVALDFGAPLLHDASQSRATPTAKETLHNDRRASSRRHPWLLPVATNRLYNSHALH